jgi:hypothetical protein
MKAEIMRRAEADSGGEEEEPRYRTERRRMIPLDEDEFDEFEDSIGNVSVAGDGEGTGSEDEEEKESVSSRPCSHQLLSISPRHQSKLCWNSHTLRIRNCLIEILGLVDLKLAQT